jgi:hypothetical protein
LVWAKNEKHKRHCGDAKGDLPIRGFIQEKDCTKYFKYNNLGEILPNGSYMSLKEYQANRGILPKGQSDALETLEVLNLNSVTLVNDRKNDTEWLIKIIEQQSKEKVEAMITDFESRTHYPRYIDMLLYYMRMKK